ncbi:MAG: tyrosine recombinase XerC [Burkholderiaceae bacterium]
MTRPPRAEPPAAWPLAERWLAQLRTERGYSERTLTSYRQALQMLRGFVDGHDRGHGDGHGSGTSGGHSGGHNGRHDETQPGGPDGDLPDWRAVGAEQVRRWVGMMARNGLAPRTIAHRLSAWRGFFDHACPGHNPARGIRAPRAPRRLPKALSPDHAHQLAEYPCSDVFESVRDKAMLELLYSAGLRLAELCSLDWQYFDTDRQTSQSWLDIGEAQVTVVGKGGKRRSVPVGSLALKALQQWLATRAQWRAGHPDSDERALFLSHLGRRLAHRTVQVRIKRLARLQGIPSNVHPHVLRHSFASHLLQSSGDLRAVQELLGHASISTTQVYTSLDFQRLAQVYDGAHPRARRR